MTLRKYFKIKKKFQKILSKEWGFNKRPQSREINICVFCNKNNNIDLIDYLIKNQLEKKAFNLEKTEKLTLSNKEENIFLKSSSSSSQKSCEEKSKVQSFEENRSQAKSSFELRRGQQLFLGAPPSLSNSQYEKQKNSFNQDTAAVYLLIGLGFGFICFTTLQNEIAKRVSTLKMVTRSQLKGKTILSNKKYLIFNFKLLGKKPVDFYQNHLNFKSKKKSLDEIGLFFDNRPYLDLENKKLLNIPVEEGDGDIVDTVFDLHYDPLRSDHFYENDILENEFYKLFKKGFFSSFFLKKRLPSGNIVTSQIVLSFTGAFNKDQTFMFCTYANNSPWQVDVTEFMALPISGFRHFDEGGFLSQFNAGLISFGLRSAIFTAGLEELSGNHLDLDLPMSQKIYLRAILHQFEIRENIFVLEILNRQLPADATFLFHFNDKPITNQFL